MSQTTHPPQDITRLTPAAKLCSVPPGTIRDLLPGLGLVVMIALIATLIQRVTGVAALSPLMLAMVLGIIVRNSAGIGARAVPGIKFSLRRILRGAIILLGFQLTLAQLADVGLSGFLAVAATLVASFVFITRAGIWLGVEPRLTQLIAAGTSVCGASAVVATNTVTRGTDEDVAYAIACVTVFGSLSMLAFPLIGPAIGLDASQFGLWVGASVHEVAQVTGAAFQGGLEAGQSGTVAKLARVILLAPLILTLGAMARRRGAKDAAGQPQTPWFVIGFVAMVVLNSIWPVSGTAKEVIVTATAFMLTIALAAMGLETDIRKLRAKGVRPLALGALGWIFISVFALAAIALI